MKYLRADPDPGWVAETNYYYFIILELLLIVQMEWQDRMDIIVEKEVPRFLPAEPKTFFELFRCDIRV